MAVYEQSLSILEFVENLDVSSGITIPTKKNEKKANYKFTVI